MDKRLWLNQLLDAYETKLLCYTKRFVSVQAAQDIVQEAFFRIWQEDLAQVEGHELQWLYRVCRNLAINQGKRDGLEVGVDVSLLNIPHGGGSAEAGLLKNEREETVASMLRKLPEKIQEVLRLKFVDGFSYKEISEVTGHSVSYVGVLIHEGVAAVRNELELGDKPTEQRKFE